VPGAIIIQFLGGIHEIYFPYVLMKPKLILGVICGGAAGVLTEIVTGAGLVATPSPGSIFAYFAETPRGGYFAMLAGVFVAAGVSWFACSALMGFGVRERNNALVRPEDVVTLPAPVPTPAPAGAATTTTAAGSAAPAEA
jgi:PTS system mannitol-specific IIC component